jgi:flagellar motility protein MotE (MotC chaperone)
MLKLLSKIRFLPLTIFAATLLLTVKVGNIWSVFDKAEQGAIQISGAIAQTDTEVPTPKEIDQISKKKANGETKDGGKTTKLKSPSTPGDGKEEQSKLITEDPTLLTEAEIDLLQKLSERRRFWELREQELETRTGLLSAAEIRIEKKVEELRVLQVTITGLLKTFDAQQDAKLLSLVKIYENMKPKDAAKIFEDLEMNTLLDVAERMKERKLAPVMAKMNPEKAREMTVELSQLRNLPSPIQPGG